MMSNTPSSGFGPPGVLDDRVVMFSYDPEGADDNLYWYDTDDRNCRGRIFRENIIVVIPADDAEDGYYILSMVCGDERPEYHKESDFAYKIRKQYAAGLPLRSCSGTQCILCPSICFVYGRGKTHPDST
jgi:hypothetical protein